ncbi:MAG: flavodoxin family protein [Clostridium sp.]|nr:flavodoxin family protein [Clostridium sp.]
MKILGISGGRKNGNNDSMCKEALFVAKELGAEIEFIRLMDLDIKHCTGCTACVASLMSGRGNRCIHKDDFDWLLDKMLDADGILFAIPIFEKGAPGIFHTLLDRFGPRMDRGNNIYATELAKKNGGTIPDPRILKDKVVSYMGLGGSDWITKLQCDTGIQALTPMWKIIDNEVFPWSSNIIVDEDRIKRVQEIGKNLAEAAKDINNASYKGEEGVCPHCHSKNFFLDNKSTKAICCTCGIEGNIEIVNRSLKFKFPKEQLTYAHDTLTGKEIHASDIGKTIETLAAVKNMDIYKERMKKYKEIQSIKPE